MKIAFSLNISMWVYVALLVALTVWDLVDPGGRFSAALIGFCWGWLAMAVCNGGGR